MSVYFVASADMQRIKIGKSDDAVERFVGLCRQNPYPLLLLAVIDGSRYVEIELHDRPDQVF